METIVVTDFNADLFTRLLNNSVREAGLVHAAHYGQVFQKLIELKNSKTDHKNLIVWARPEFILPSLFRVIQFEPFDPEKIFEEVQDFSTAIKEAAKKIPNVFVMSMHSDAGFVTHGMLNYRKEAGVRYWIDRINVELAEQFSGTNNIYLLDTSRYFYRISSPKAHKLYYSAKVPYGMEVFSRASLDIQSCLQGLRGKARRVLALDLDNTLWGGVLGDVGLRGIKLGGHDHMGEAFADFQQAVKRLANRGVALVVVSKNYELNALDVFDNHPEMALHRADLSAWRINWDDKAQNIVDIAKELNLGLESFVFIDDNPLERARVSEALPSVLVPDWPTDPAEYVDALNSLTCFNVPSISLEDARRTEMFVAERSRQKLKNSMNHDAWLETIEMRVAVEKPSPGNISRIVQLINKSNQFNARTRRVSETKIAEMQNTPGSIILGFRVSDKYGDSGLTGVISAKMVSDSFHIVDFVMSCRVMGRGVERLMLSELTGFASQNGAKEIVCEVVETERNLPMREFLDGSGLLKNSNKYCWKLPNRYPRPHHITVIHI